MSLIIAGPYTVIPAPTRRGFGTAYCQRQTGRWSPTNGWTFDQDFRGLSLAAMQNLANLYGNAGIEYELTYQNGISTLRTRDTTGNITIDVWEITASRISLSIFGNPQIIANVTANDLAVIGKAYVGGFTTLADAVSALNSTTPPPGTLYTEPNLTTASAQTVWLWKKVSQDQEATYFADQYSLRHTTNASNRGYYNVADANVNRIYTQSQFYSEITNGGYWIFPAPNEIIGALNTVFNGLGSAAAGYTNGALKGGASRVTTANNRVNIVTEYLIGQICNYQYPFAS